ncbi:MAG: DUF853 family protein [Brachybacterium sp.]|nr:DUF853 family protein [Brachybacterium sp.]
MSVDPNTPGTNPAPDGATTAAGGGPEGAGAEDATATGGAALSEHATTIRDAYAFPGTRIHLGALIEPAPSGDPQPGAPVHLALSMLNRHGLIAGATGTGKTKTLQVIAEQVAAAGTPVFVADMKGDLSGIAVPGADSPTIRERAAARGQQWEPRAGTTEFYTLGGRGTGVPIRTTVSDFGPTLLAKVLGLNPTQESSLSLIFHYADQQGLCLLDLKDLRALVHFLTSDPEGKAELKGIGGVSAATAGVILRSLTAFEARGADAFFGEPAFETSALLRTAEDGTGIISCLELPGVAAETTLFSTFLMWLLADLYQELPEVGDAEQPKLVFFFDEAHLLFKDASAAFLEQVTQTVRLIRSKGVGVVFITQTPKDVPRDVLAQLGNRVQHALRAYTPEDATSLRATASTFPVSDLDLTEVLPALPTGAAVVTVMSEDGAPTPVAVTAVRAPESSMEPCPPEEMQRIVDTSALLAQYAEVIDRESAYEKLAARAETAPASTSTPPPSAGSEKGSPQAESSGGLMANPAVKSFLRSAGTVLGREITRQLFGTRRR